MKSFLHYKLFVLQFALCFFYGCAPETWKQAQNEYANGNYQNAINLTARTLKDKPNYEDAVKFLEDILPPTIDNIFNEAKNAERVGKWDLAFSKYTEIENINNIIKPLPSQKRPDSQENAKFYTKDVSEQLENARNQAAEMHYQKGIELEEKNLYKDAAKEFSAVQDYITNYKDSRQRYQKTRESAITRVAVMPFENQSGKTQFGMVGENLSDLCIGEAMLDQRNMEFLEFVTRDKLQLLLNEQNLGGSGIVDDKSAAEVGKVLGINAFVLGKVISILTDYPPETKTEFYEEAEIYQGKDKPTKKVAARVFVTNRKGKAIARCSYQIIDVNKGTIVKSGTVERSAESNIKFGRFTGDEAALKSETRELCSREEQHPPSEEILVQSAIEEVAKGLAQEITAYYK